MNCVIRLSMFEPDDSNHILQQVLFSSRDIPVLAQGLASVKIVAMSSSKSILLPSYKKGGLYK